MNLAFRADIFKGLEHARKMTEIPVSGQIFPSVPLPVRWRYCAICVAVWTISPLHPPTPNCYCPAQDHHPHVLSVSVKQEGDGKRGAVETAKKKNREL